MLRDHYQYTQAVVTAETNVVIDAPALVNGALGVITQLLLDEKGKREIATRTIQNVGATDIYVTFGFDKPNVGVYHCRVAPYAILDCGKHDKAVYGVCPDGPLIVAPCVIYRT